MHKKLLINYKNTAAIDEIKRRTED